jgi:integrase
MDGKRRAICAAHAGRRPVANLAEAKEAADVLRNDRREHKLPTSGHKPSFADYIETYFAKPATARKKPSTLKLERWALVRWKEHLGDVRVARIDAAAIGALRDKRLRSGSHPRTVNLDLIALRNVLKQAVEDGYLREMSKAKTRKAPPSPKRPLLTPSQFANLLAAVPKACEKNAVQFAGYLRFLAYSGAREQEALKIQWDDVDLAGERVTIGTGGVSKNHERSMSNSTTSSARYSATWKNAALPIVPGSFLRRNAATGMSTPVRFGKASS